MSIKIRQGIKTDLPQVFELIKELAAYENGLHEVENSVERMEEDGFGDHPIFDFFVAEEGENILGTSIFYYRFSTWKGKRLYLEDLVVRESKRGTGIGKLLLDRTVEKAKAENCTGMMWQVLDWNEPAINFYKKYGADLDGEWINCSLNF